MRAARFNADSRALALTDVPVPEPGPLEVLVKVEACGICLSDVHLMDGSIPPVVPEVTPGHESAGVVAAVGELVPGWKEGDRAVLAGGRPCGSCAHCRIGRAEDCLAFQIMGFHYDGAWAEYVTVPYFAMTPLPAGIPFEQAAILADAVATPYAAITERGALKPGEVVGLWGIGGLGTHAVQIARLCGASFIVAVDPLATARDRALRLGADVALDPGSQDVPREIRVLTDGTGLDLALDLVGANVVLQQCVSSLGLGGRAVMVGLSLESLHLEPSLLFGIQKHSVLGHLGYDRRHLDALVQLLARGRLDLSASISDVIPLDDVADGVRRLAEKDGDPVRIMVRPQG
ncbi:MAG: zinc-binding dehydrogenase [Actinomycetota bacterium]|nr:zinc-binding dehydrogenase [Actinomycetota bacterium]